jgi:hypothetical protein
VEPRLALHKPDLLPSKAEQFPHSQTSFQRKRNHRPHVVGRFVHEPINIRLAQKPHPNRGLAQKRHFGHLVYPIPLITRFAQNAPYHLNAAIHSGRLGLDLGFASVSHPGPLQLPQYLCRNVVEILNASQVTIQPSQMMQIGCMRSLAFTSLLNVLQYSIVPRPLGLYA